ncbi:MAG: AAA family ATPase, partial [Candidatus Cloacimonadaceae bacterium]
DLIDEACAQLRMEIDSLPVELDEVQRKLRQLEIEKLSLEKEKDELSKQRLDKIRQEISELSETGTTLRARWENEKAMLQDIRTLKEELDNLKAEAEKSERAGDYEKVAKLRYGTLVEKEKQLETLKARLKEVPNTEQLLKEQVDEEMIAEVVSKWTKISVSKLIQSELQKLIKLEEILGQRVIGQEEGIAAVSNAIRRSRSGLSDTNRPIGSFMFLGPTGVGKTELAKTLAAFLFDTEKALVRIDMSEFMEKHSVARLIGAPPGYVGYEEGGYLTEAVRRRPYCVILFDEVEKAHQDVFNVLLQILDEGRLTDGKGRTVDFRNAVIILTSNIGSQLIFEAEDTDPETLRPQLMQILQQHFRPEFLNRLDDIIIFHRLNQSHMHEIVKLQLDILKARLAEKNINVQFTEDLVDWLTVSGYDAQFGARPLKRLIQKELENQIALALLSGEVDSGLPLTITEKGGKVVFSNL